MFLTVGVEWAKGPYTGGGHGGRKEIYSYRPKEELPTSIAGGS